MDDSDSKLLTRIAGGDRDAFAAFYDRYAARILGLLSRMLGRGRDAEDVLQETFWQVWKRAEQYDPARANAFAWLVMIARSRAIDLRRKNARTVAAGTEMDDSLAAAPMADGPATEDERRKTHEALGNLPAEQKMAIQLAFFGGLTHEEIAGRLGLSLGTVKTRIRLGMIKLRDRMGAKSSENG